LVEVSYSTLKENLRKYFDKATNDNEAIIVKSNDNKNAVIISLDDYNEITKIKKNAEYLAKIERGYSQIAKGQGQIHELIDEEL